MCSWSFTSEPPRRAAAGWAPALVLALGALAAQPVAPPPYRLRVNVAWGSPQGPASFREALEAEILSDLAAHHCFREAVARVPAPAAPDDLELVVTIDGYEEESDFEHAISAHGENGGVLRQGTTSFEGRFTVVIRTTTDGRLVRSRAVSRRGAWSGTGPEDPRDAAQRALIENVVRTVHSLSCKGSAENWAREIERARTGER